MDINSKWYKLTYGEGFSLILLHQTMPVLYRMKKRGGGWEEKCQGERESPLKEEKNELI